MRDAAQFSEECPGPGRARNRLLSSCWTPLTVLQRQSCWTISGRGLK